MLYVYMELVAHLVCAEEERSVQQAGQDWRAGGGWQAEKPHVRLELSPRNV